MTELVNQQTGELTKLPSIGAGGELQVSASATAVMQEIQGAMVLAKHFPRDYMTCWNKLADACRRKSLADKALYSFPRGGAKIEGPSVNLARVASQCYSNIRTGLDILRDDDESMHIRGWAWDIENNIKVTADDVFKKLIFRKGKGWIKPDERDLRELVFRRGAILKRNCIFEVLPKDYVDDAVGLCKQTMKSAIKDPKGEAKRLVLEFGNLNVSIEKLRAYVGHADDWSPDEIVDLQGVLTSIKDSNSKPDDYFKNKPLDETPDNDDGLSAEKMKAGNPLDHQGFEPQDKDESEEPDRETIIARITGLEASKKLGKMKIPDLRVEHVGQADVNSAPIPNLQRYSAWLEAQPSKKKSGGEKGDF